MRGHRHHHHHQYDPQRYSRSRTLRQILFRGAFGAIALAALITFAIMHFMTRMGRGPAMVPLAIGVGVLVLWAGSAGFSRRLARPLRNLVEVAKKIGAGDLAARADLGWHGFREVHMLGDAMRDMAERLEQQVGDQRALLAGASHELRTPLQHMKLLVEILRAQPSEKALADLEREIEDVDNLVGKLLASSRLDFSKLERIDVDAADLARRALERAHEKPDLLEVHGTELRFSGDPTLLVRALENLLENAREHGKGVQRVVLERTLDRLTFTVLDAGPGLPVGEEAKVLEPFFHRGQSGSLGLGLHLVRRIAQSHGGDAFARNRDGGGAEVGFFVRA